MEQSKTGQNLNFFEQLINNSFDIVTLISLEGIIIFENLATTRILGYEPDSRKDLSFFDNLHPLDKKLFLKKLENSHRNTEATISVTYRYLKANGKWIWLETKIKNHLNNPDFSGFLLNTRDIDDNKNAEKALARNEEKFRLLAKHTADGLVIINRDGKVEYASPAYYKQLGYSALETQDKKINDLRKSIHPEEREDLLFRLYKAIDQKQENITYTFRTKHKLGHYIWRKDTARFVYNSEGEYIRSYVVCRDISYEKETLTQLEEANSLTRTIINSTEDIIVYKDKNLKYFLVNDAMCRFTGKTEEELIGSSDQDIFPPEEAGKFRKDDRWVMKYKKSINTDEEIKSSKTIRWANTSKSPVLDSSGNLLGIVVIVRDITQRKATEEELAKARTILEKSEEISEFGSFEWDIPSDMMTLSPGWQKTHGIYKDKLKVPELDKIAYPKDKGMIYKAFEDALSGRKPYVLEHRIIRQSDQEVRTISVSGKVVFDENNVPLKMYGSTEDITERKKFESSLLESEAKYKALTTEVLDNMDVGVFILDADFRVVWMNLAIERFMGIDREKAEGKDKKELIEESIQHKFEDPASFREKIFNSYENNSFTQNFICTIKKGAHKSARILRHYSRPIETGIYKGGRVEYYYDITEQHKAEEELRGSLIDLKLSQKIAKIGNWQFDPEVGIPEWSSNVYDIYEMKPGTRPPSLEEYKKIYGASQYKKFSEAIRKALHEGISYDIELYFRLKNGKKKWIRAICQPERRKKKSVHFLRGTIQDITSRKEAEKIILENEKRYRKLNATKDKLFSIISHDLRSPLSGIHGVSGLALERLDNRDYGKVEKFIQQIHRSSTLSIKILDNILSWSRFQTGRLDFHPEAIDLGKKVADISHILSANILEKQIKISVHIKEKVKLYADAFMLEIILRNLLSNAIKFSPKGSVIDIFAEDKKSHTLIEVRDYGIGMSPDILKRLFHVEKTTTRHGTNDEKGSGLGLMLCKDFVTKHKGKIWAESEENKGSGFYLSFPLKK